MAETGFWSFIARYGSLLFEATEPGKLRDFTRAEEFELINSVSKEERKEFVQKYYEWRHQVLDYLYNRGHSFSEYVGSDDGHSDLASYIVLSGKATVDRYLLDNDVDLVTRIARNYDEFHPLWHDIDARTGEWYHDNL